MELYTHKDYTIVNHYDCNRYGFKHISYLFKNGTIIDSHTVHYINRTWESYTYRTSMRAVLSDRIEFIESRYLTNYKNANNIQRLTAKRRDIALKECYESNFMDVKTIKEFYDKL